jgi:hypothetical protein
MTDLRRRGRLHADDLLFAADQLGKLRSAATDLAWLLERGYAADAALKLVGDRRQLSARQRTAVRRATAPSSAAADRRRRRLPLAAIRDQDLAIDGFNALITVESALTHGTVIRGHDGAHRDLASVHGSYKQVLETGFAIDAIGGLLAAASPRSVTWYLDRPVSSSGRLRALLLERAAARGWAWTVELPQNPDPVLARISAIVATSDAWILDHCSAWVDLLGGLLEAGSSPAAGPTLAMRPDLWLVDLTSAGEVDPRGA